MHDPCNSVFSMYSCSGFTMHQACLCMASFCTVMLAQAVFDLPFSFHWGCGYHLKQTNKQTKTTCSNGRPGYKLEVCVIIILLQIFSEIFLLNCWHMPQNAQWQLHRHRHCMIPTIQQVFQTCMQTKIEVSWVTKCMHCRGLSIL